MQALTGILGQAVPGRGAALARRAAIAATAISFEHSVKKADPVSGIGVEKEIRGTPPGCFIAA